MNKYKLFMIISLIILAMSIIGSALAFFKWTSEKEALVNVTVSSGGGSCSLTSDNELEIFPTYSKYHGRKIRLNARQEMAEKAYITWTMVINEINGLQDKTFMYELVNNTTGESYGSGTFENITNTEGSNTITFSNSEEVLGYNKDYEFTLYLWIDGTIGENPISMANQTFDFDMNCSITGTDEGEVIEQYTLMSVTNAQSATSSFLRSELTREQIGSITFVNDMEIPGDAIDVSQNNDGSVMMWYGEANSNNLYDVYIGTNGGIISLSSGNYLFSNLTNIQTLDLTNINTSNVTSMYQMFYGCSSIETLDISSFDTSKVTNMSAMYQGCNSLKTLELSNFDTSNVTNMSAMFNGGSSLTTLGLSSFNTSNVTNMSQIFLNCSSLTSLDLSNFDTSQVRSMQGMFNNCSSLTSLDLSNFKTSSVESGYWGMTEMFRNCSSLISLDVSNFDVSNVTLFSNMFYNCKSLTSLDVSEWDTSNITDMGALFAHCSSLTSLDVSNWDTSKVVSLWNTFIGCSSLTSLDVSKWDTSSVTNMGSTFEGCSSLTTLDVSKWDTSSVTRMDSMFQRCTGLTELDLSGFETDSLKNMEFMFAYCSKLANLNLSTWKMSKVSNMNYTFFACGLKLLDLSNAEFSSVTTWINMLSEVYSEEYEYVIKGNEVLKTWFTTNYTDFADKVEIPVSS